MALYTPTKPKDHENDKGAARVYRPAGGTATVDVVNDYY